MKSKSSPLQFGRVSSPRVWGCLFLIFLLILIEQQFAQAGSDFSRDAAMDSAFGESVAVGNKVYHKISIVSLEDDILVMNTKEGRIKVPLASLPTDFLKRHAWDFEKLRIAAAENAAREAKEASGVKWIPVLVIQNTENGILADVMDSRIIGTSSDHSGGYHFRKALPSAFFPSGKLIFVQGMPEIADQTKVWISAKRDGLYRYENIGGSISTVEKWIFVSMDKP